MDIIVKNTRELSRRFRAAAGRGAGGAHTKKNESHSGTDKQNDRE